MKTIIPIARLLNQISTGLAALLLMVLPFLAALDYGGILWWTQYVVGLTVFVAFLLSLPTIVDRANQLNLRQLLILVPMLLWLLYTTLQVVEFPLSWLSWLSPGSFNAYTKWLNPILPSEPLPNRAPVSIFPEQTRHALGIFSIAIVATWAAMRIFNTRLRMIALLSSVAISGAAVSLIGILRLTLPQLHVFDYLNIDAPSSFSTFVNRNNAALFMNIGLAASLGLLAWRLSALTGQEIDEEGFEVNDLFSLASDRDSLIGVSGATLCLLGLLVCGSRGGLASALLGFLFSIGWLRKKKGVAAIAVTMGTVLVISFLLVAPLNLELQSIDRLAVLSDESSSITKDGRLEHWPEAFAAGINYFPSGSGMGTYADAHLPYLSQSGRKTQRWFAHADNLWLESWVEQGLIGILFVVTILSVLVWCLVRMSTSHDSLDHGLRISGWYIVAALAFSQILDFGLILPANHLLAISLLAAIVSQSRHSNLVKLTEKVPSLLSINLQSLALRRLQRVISLMVTGTILVLAVASLNTLRKDAEVDSTVRFTQQALAGKGRALTELRFLREHLHKMNNGRSTAVQANLADLEHRIARVIETTQAQPASEDEAKILFRFTSPRFRRVLSRIDSVFAPELADEYRPAVSRILQGDSSLDYYRSAASYYKRELMQRPLSRKAREGLLYLDFADENDSPTELLIEQLKMLHHSSPSRLLALAELTAESCYTERAENYWREALKQQPDLTDRAIKTIEQYREVKLENCLPRDSKVYQIAALSIVRRREHRYDDLMPQLIDALDCSRSTTISENVDCLRLRGLAYESIGKLDPAIESFTRATKIDPDNGAMRLELISLLRKAGARKMAIEQARLGRQIDPTNKQFTAVIKEMAADDLRLSVPRSSK